LEKCDFCLIIGSDLRSEASSLNLVIKKRVLEGSLQVGYIGPSIDMLYPYKHLGLGLDSLMLLVKGKHPFSVNLKKSKNLSIIIGERFNYANIYSLVSKLSSLNYLDSLNLANINVLRTKSSSIAFSEVGINSLKLNKKFDLLILIGVDDLKFYRLSNPDSFIIYIGSHFSVYNLELADLILPASLFLEKDFTTINLENRIKTSKALRKVSGDVRSEYFLLLVLISFLNNNLNLGELKKDYMFDQLFIKEYPFIAKNNFKIAEFLLGGVNYSTLRNEILSSHNVNFYGDNSVIRSSRNFKYCLNNLKKIQFKKKNVV
jgi:NADH-quinone oxidoreductase subunit G